MLARLTGSQSLSSDLVIANKSITILVGQTTLAMGSNRIVVQPGANQFAFTGYSAGMGAWTSPILRVERHCSTAAMVLLSR